MVSVPVTGSTTSGKQLPPDTLKNSREACKELFEFEKIRLWSWNLQNFDHTSAAQLVGTRIVTQLIGLSGCVLKLVGSPELEDSYWVVNLLNVRARFEFWSASAHVSYREIARWLSLQANSCVQLCIEMTPASFGTMYGPKRARWWCVMRRFFCMRWVDRNLSNIL